MCIFFRRAAPLLAALLLACGGSETIAGAAASAGDPAGAGSGGSGATSGSTSTTVASSGSDASSSGAGANGGGGNGAGGGAPACSGLTIGPGDYDLAIDSDGVTRDYHLHVPPGYSPDTRAMLMLVFHGWLESMDDIQQISEMNAESDAHGFVAVYPQGLDESWNAGDCCGQSASDQVDDVGLATALLDRLEADLCVDPRRVFTTGFSNGGMLSHRLGCEVSSRFAAIGAVSGTMAVDACPASRPVPVVHFHGTSDYVVPYNGGGFANAHSVDDTIAGWALRNACSGQPVNVYAQGDVTCDEYEACAEGASVRLCKVEGGGHQWPGGQSAGPGGPLTTDIDASATLYAFFSAHAMP